MIQKPASYFKNAWIAELLSYYYKEEEVEEEEEEEEEKEEEGERERDKKHILASCIKTVEKKSHYTRPTYFLVNSSNWKLELFFTKYREESNVVEWLAEENYFESWFRFFLLKFRKVRSGISMLSSSSGRNIRKNAFQRLRSPFLILFPGRTFHIFYPQNLEIDKLYVVQKRRWKDSKAENLVGLILISCSSFGFLTFPFNAYANSEERNVKFKVIFNLTKAWEEQYFFFFQNCKNIVLYYCQYSVYF